jgi:tRNA threonylcarbamoyladenosine biosynthesis protein TsaB
MSRARFVLGIDTAGRFGSIALAENGSALAWEPLAPGGHSSGLSRAGERILSGGNLTWSDLTGVAVVSGPGSFTGLRIGLAWAKGICFGSRAKLALVSAHDANAHRHRRERGWIATVLSGERGEAQAALWAGGEGPARVWGPESVPERELAGALRAAAAAHARAGTDAVAGSGGGSIAVAGPDLKQDVLDALRGAGFRLLADTAPPAAAAVAELGDRMLLAGEEADLVRSAPAYGRSPNARKPAT